MLENSDRLFPDMKPTGEDKKPFQHPIKGWIPRGWDDGAGYDKNTWKPFEDSYFTSSNHLMQDIADALLNVWMTTQDPQIAQAIMHIHNYKREYFGAIPVIDFAAGVANSASELYESHRLPVFSTSVMNPYYTGMYEQKAHSLSSYDDNLAWEYRYDYTTKSRKPRSSVAVSSISVSLWVSEALIVSGVVFIISIVTSCSA